MANKFKPPDYSDDIDEGIFVFAEEGRCVYRPPVTAWENIDRTDIIHFDEAKHGKELHSNIKIGDSATAEIKNDIMNIVKRHWDAFCTEGCRRPIIGYEFAIDTSTSTPVCKYHIMSYLIICTHNFISISSHTLS